jgi:photosystem II stability/assembly factor-like uncharacterized protein
MVCLATLTIAGCGSQHYGSGTGLGASSAGHASTSGSGSGAEVPTSAVEEIGAAGAYAWARTDSSLYTSDDGGKSWSIMQVGTGGVPVAAVRIGQDEVWAITESAGSLSVQHSKDHGKSWTAVPLNTQSVAIATMPAQVDPVSSSDVFVSLAGQGPVSPDGELLASSDGGTTFNREPEPVTGHIAFSNAGDGLLAGGLADDFLYFTGNAGISWTKIGLPMSAPSGILALGSPFAQAGTYYVPVTIQALGSGELSFQLLKGLPGGLFSAVSAPMSVSGTNLGPGTPITTGDYMSDVWAAAPDGSQIYESTNLGGSWTTVRTSGLPTGAVQLALTGSNSAIALVANGSCTSFKSGCTEKADVYRTTDSGATWSESFPA